MGRPHDRRRQPALQRLAANEPRGRWGNTPALSEIAFFRMWRLVQAAKREKKITKKIMSALLAALVLVGMTACGRTPGGRAVSGGLLGAGAGAGIGAATGGNVGTGALVGGGIGAAGGALTAPRR